MKNVLLISVDHWMGSLLGCRGHQTIMTPTLNCMARDGMLFENAYSTCPVCIPARRSLMTGLSPRTHGDRIYSDRMPMPEATTLAQAFRDAGYQAYGVGKLHVYPQRSRIGFDDVILMEEGRYDFGVLDDYQIALGEEGHVGEEFLHSCGNNTYYTRPWHLDEKLHPSTWATRQMMKTIKRRDPNKPGFYYISYQFPHPPLVPLQEFLDLYNLDEIDDSVCGDFVDDSTIMKILTESSVQYSEKEVKLAKRAFYAQCTHIDQQIRLLIGTLREESLLDDTIIGFFSDHGDMLFDHNLVAKRCFYERAAQVPLILSGKPLESYAGTRPQKLAILEDVMPTLLAACGVEIPATVEGIDLLSEQSRDYIYGEISNGRKATRMIRDKNYKLIYYPCGNVFQLFDMENDRKEMHNLITEPALQETIASMKALLITHLYDTDLEWIQDGKLVGFDAGEFKPSTDYNLYNQRGYHWPAPSEYHNIGANA